MNQAFEILKARALSLNLPSMDEYEYKKIHTKPLLPLSLKIDCDQFLEDIIRYDSKFRQWGNRYTELPRYGLPLVNENGSLDNPIDPTLGSLSHWNEDYPSNPYMETDFEQPTEAMYMKSLQPLRIFHEHWTRSNILKWYNGAEFKPHIDTTFPALWFRFWATTDPSTIKLGFENNGQIEYEENIEPGRLYLIDTSIIHVAQATGLNYQFFLSVNPSACTLIKTLLVADR